jgi:hypothetical protein
MLLIWNVGITVIVANVQGLGENSVHSNSKSNSQILLTPKKFAG